MTSLKTLGSLIIYRGKSFLEEPLHTRRELLDHAVADITNDGDSVRLSQAFKG